MVDISRKDFIKKASLLGLGGLGLVGLAFLPKMGEGDDGISMPAKDLDNVRVSVPKHLVEKGVRVWVEVDYEEV